MKEVNDVVIDGVNEGVIEEVNVAKVFPEHSGFRIVGSKPMSTERELWVPIPGKLSRFFRNE